MKTGTMGSGRFGRFVMALGALSLGLLVTGCGEECVDRFDCANKRGAPSEGQQYQCVDNRCEVRDIADAGTDPVDAGTDAGVTCTDLPHDAKLGTLQLQTGFAAAESVTLPEGIGAVSAVQSGSDFTLYGVTGGNDNSLYALGTWPDIAASTTPLQPIIPEADQGAFPSGYLTNDGTRLLTGYTMFGEGFPGKVLVYDTTPPAESSYFSAAGNFTAAAVPGAFFINGLGLEGVAGSGTAAIYALKTDARPFQGTKLASFPASNAASGYTAVTSDNIAVLGYSVPDPEGTGSFPPPINRLTAVAPSVYSQALASGTPFELSSPNAIEIYSDTDLQGAAGFGDGVALHRGSYTATQDVSRIELKVDGITPGTVTAGDLQAVLTTSNTCTNVVTMAPLGADLLVGVADKNGRRLVRLQKQ